MKTNFGKIIFGVAVVALSMVACQKNGDVASPLDLGNEKAQAQLLECTNCIWQADAVDQGSNIDTPVYYYENWAPETWTIPCGEQPVIQWEGQYVSFARPITEDWYIGTIEIEQDTCNWEILAPLIKVKNVSPTYLGTAPSVSPYTPYNVVGADGTLFAPPSTNYFFNLGYYTYVNRVPTPFRYIVVWKETGLTWPTDVSDPENADEAYIIRVTDIDAGGISPNFTSDISLEWRRVL